MLRLGRTVLTYRGCVRWSAATTLAVAGLLIGGGITGAVLVTGTAAGAIGLGWAAFTLRMIRLAPSCPGPGGGSGPGGTGVREPRRPRPTPPGGAIALPLPDSPPGGAAATV
ncbi:hypothetical protein [Streptomyces sp. NPDC002133]|uniref:hypothetical protein n=1 Tax=Streptomyces sp. NPDC002133 TaxID=3154409 RepID=UPI00332175AB